MSLGPSPNGQVPSGLVFAEVAAAPLRWSQPSSFSGGDANTCGRNSFHLWKALVREQDKSRHLRKSLA